MGGIATGTTVLNTGTVDFAGNLTIDGTLVNRATAILIHDVPAVTIAGAGMIQNLGTVTHAGGNNLTIGCKSDNSGIVTSSGAALALSGGGTQSGSFTSLDSLGVIRFTGGIHDLGLGSTYGGAGTYAATAGTVNFNADLTLTNWSFSGAVPIVTAGQTVTLQGTTTWSNGNINGPGTFDNLVSHPHLITGYSRFNFVRASVILNCQSTPRCLARKELHEKKKKKRLDA